MSEAGDRVPRDPNKRCGQCEDPWPNAPVCSCGLDDLVKDRARLEHVLRYPGDAWWMNRADMDREMAHIEEERKESNYD